MLLLDFMKVLYRIALDVPKSLRESMLFARGPKTPGGLRQTSSKSGLFVFMKSQAVDIVSMVHAVMKEV